MAIDDYVITPVPDCVDTPTVNQWLQNLNALMEGGLQATGGVSCIPVEGALNDGECLKLDSTSSLQLSSLGEATGAIEKKIFLVAAKVTVGQSRDNRGGPEGLPVVPPAGQQDVNFAITAVCGNTQFATTTIQTSPQDSVLYFNANMIGECPAGTPIEVCVDIVSDSLPPGFSKPTINVILCGAMLCVSEASQGFLSDIPGFFCAPDVPPGCLIGREGIHLMQQNTRALCSFAGQGYLESNCDFSFTFEDADSHTLATPQNDVQYLIVGSARICGRYLLSNRDDPVGQISAQISGGCSNGSTTSCFSITQELSGNGPGVGGEVVCFTVPFVACGNCLAGGTLFAGINTGEQCSDTDTSLDQTFVEITSVSQTYTVFTFRRVDPIAEGLIPIYEEQRVDKCISRDSVEYLVEKADALFNYFCELQDNVIGCQRIADAFGPVASAGTLYAGVIRPPSPPPPATVPPTPIPTSKVNVMCNLRICMRNEIKTADRTVLIEITVSCAGANPYTLTTNCVIPKSQGGSTDGIVVLGSDTICKDIPFIHTYSGCLITDPVNLEISALGDDVEVTGSFDCLSFNI